MIDRSLFNVEDFLVDNTFQAYCAGTDKLCISYWENYIQTHPDQQAVIDEAKRLYFILSGNKKPLNTQVEALKNNIEQQNNRSSIFSKSYSWLKIAAMLVLITGVALFYFRKGDKEDLKPVMANNFTTKAGERKKITLKDGSVILLNSKSSLSIAKGFNEKSREVSLIGEAFFDVMHQIDKPFKVHTEDFDINVLGTSFNVKIYPDEPTSETTLIKGLIMMEGKGSKSNSITLRPSQKVTFYKNQKPSSQRTQSLKVKEQLPEISINHYTKINDSVIAEVAWTQDRLEISDQSFAELKSILERWYDVQVEFTDRDVEKYRFTASFPRENIEQALNALQAAEHFNYKIKGKQITISK